jgi:hypothetical protein
MSDLLDDEMSLKNQRSSMSMSDLIDYQSDNELEDGDDGDIYFNQDSLLDTLRRQSKVTSGENVLQPFIHSTNDPAESYATPQCRNEFIFKRPAMDFDDDLTSESRSSMCMSEKTICVNLDSDEGSISSGCETSSTVTATADEGQLPRRGSVLDRVRNFEQMADTRVKAEPIGERGASGKFFPRSVTYPTNAPGKPGNFIIASNESGLTKNGTLTRGDNGNVARNGHDDDSDELSDESGYVEFQDLSLKSVFA